MATVLAALVVSIARGDSMGFLGFRSQRPPLDMAPWARNAVSMSVLVAVVYFPIVLGGSDACVGLGNPTDKKCLCVAACGRTQFRACAFPNSIFSNPEKADPMLHPPGLALLWEMTHDGNNCLTG